MTRARRMVVPKFIQINTQADYNKHIKPALGKGADAYGLEDIKGMWWELDDDTRLGAAKTMREIRDGIDKRPRIIFISGAGDERGITDLSLTEYAENMGLSVKDYLNGFTLESRNVMTAWSYLEELAALEGMESRMEATEKILKALGYRKGPGDAWLDEDGSEIDVTDVLDNAEWALAVKVCGPLQESKNEGAIESNTPKSYVLAHKGPNDTTYCKNKAGDWTTHIEDAWDGSGPDSFSAEMKRNFADAVHCDVEDLEVVPVEKFESFESNGTNETIEFEKGHKNSRGENAPWVIRDHKNGKVLASFAKKSDAEAHLERMGHYKRNENSVMDWANKIKGAVANAAKAAGLENRITASATNMPKLFVDVYQIGTMGDGINWEITRNLGVRRFDRQNVKRHWSVDSIEELEKSLTDEFRQLKSGKFTEETKTISDSDLLARLKAADPEKGKYIIRAFHDSEGYWVWFPDEVSTYEPTTHTLHEYSVAELLRAYKRSKIVGAKGENYERATKEIQVRKNGQPWIRYAVTWPEYVDTYTKEAKQRGWDEVRVIDLGGKGKHEALFNAKALEDLAMNGLESAIMAAWSGAGVKNFKLDIQRDGYNFNVYSKTLDGTPTGTSWRVLPMEGSVVRYTDNLTNGGTDVAEDIPYITEDDIERIFTDEFKKLDDGMSEGYAGKEGDWRVDNPDGFKKLNDQLEAAGFQCTFDNRFGDELVARDGEKFYVIEYNAPPDMVVDKNKPWEIFNGDSGEFIKNFADPETVAAYLIAKKSKE